MFDANKPFGYAGYNTHGWKYYQDGKYYNKDYQELDEHGNLANKEVISTDLVEKPVKKKRTYKKKTKKDK